MIIGQGDVNAIMPLNNALHINMVSVYVMRSLEASVASTLDCRQIDAAWSWAQYHIRAQLKGKKK